MGDDKRAVNTEESLRNGISQPRVGVGVLLVDQQGRVLLTLREFPPEAGCWSIVGGKLDFLEALEDGAVREAFEEVGLKIALDSLLWSPTIFCQRKVSTGFRPLIWDGYWQAKQETVSRRTRATSDGFGMTNFQKGSP